MKIFKLFKIFNKYRKKQAAERAHNALLIDTLRTKLINSEIQVAMLDKELTRLKEDLAKNFVYITYLYDSTQLISLPKCNINDIDYKVSIPKPEFILCYKNKPLKDYEEAVRKLIKIAHYIKCRKLQFTDDLANVYYETILKIIKGKYDE